MDNEEYNLLQDVKHLKDKKKLITIGTSIGAPFFEIYKDANGKEATDVGRAMLGYYLDLFEKDISLGMDATKVIFSGYPGYPHTDLVAPYHASFRTRKAWLNAINMFDRKNDTVQVLTFSTYFHWYATTYELFRKMLVFDCYCFSKINPTVQMNLENQLFGTSNPAKILSNSGNSSRKKLLDYYDPTVRHAIAHANTLIIPNSMIVIRSSDSEKSQINEKVYNGPDEFINDVSINIETMFLSIRMFYTLFLHYLFGRNTALFKKYIGKELQGLVLAAIMQDIKDYFSQS